MHARVFLLGKLALRGPRLNPNIVTNASAQQNNVLATAIRFIATPTIARRVGKMVSAELCSVNGLGAAT
jgi:hypothetical protein